MIGLYLHIPFCRRKCAYCDFYSIEDLSYIDRYVQALCSDFEKVPAGIEVDTVFFGGGTPSLLSPAHWQHLVTRLRAHFNIQKQAEITVEVNPDTLSDALCHSLVECGVNRISTGVQSLDNCVLHYAGRLHDAKGAIAAVSTAKRYFDNVSVDYMIGFPFQNPSNIADDMAVLCDLGVTHVSVYALQVEPDTPLFRRTAVCNDLPDADQTVALYDAAMQALAQHGLFRYEISNFCLPNHRCRHNDNCWHYHEYLGFGPTAHSFYKGKRFYQNASVADYCMGVDDTRDDMYKLYSNRQSDEKDAASIDFTARFEMLMLALRTTDGLYLDDYTTRFGTHFDQDFALPLLDKRVQKTTCFDNNRFLILPQYLYISNSIIQLFMPE